jgi:multiple sugar transport system substrate-binding protein
MHHARRIPVSQYLVRAVLTLVVLAAAGGVAMLTVRGSGNGTVELSVFWWGGKTRATITDKVLELYTQKHPNVTFKKQWQGNSGYYDKLATMASSGKAPDLFQIDDNGLTQYATRGVTLDLKPYLGNRIRVDDFPQPLRQIGTVTGRVAGIAAAENTPAMVFDRTMIEQLHLDLPRVGLSWQGLVDWSVQVYNRSGGKKYGTMNPAADYKALQVWLRQQGKDLYDGGNLGFTQDDLTRWLRFWADAQARHATPPADIVHTANTGDVSKQLVETGKAAISFMWSNQLEELQKGTKDDLDIVTYPGDPSGQWLRASMYWSGFSGTKHREEVADVINFMVNDVDAARVLGAERGLAPNLGLRSAIGPMLTDAMQTTATFETSLATQFGAPPAPPPAGHSQIRSQLLAAAETVQFAKATPEQAAATFFKSAKSVLGP